MKIVFASGNAHKIREVKEILASCPSTSSLEVLSLKDIGFFEDIEENGATFEENALIKARAVSARGYICFADDSGLEVDALGGAPGIYSARYTGVHGTDEDNNALLLKNLENVPDEKRTAHYTCAIACVFPNGEEFTVRDICEGKIIREARGNGGFGYDPYFYVKEYDKTLAEVTAEEKHAISHRGKALRLFADTLGKKLKDI